MVRRFRRRLRFTARHLRVVAGCVVLLYATPVHATPTYESKTDASVTNGGSLSVDRPAGTAQWDVLLAFFASHEHAEMLTGPSGWTLLGNTKYVTTGGIQGSVYYRQATASEAETYLFEGTSGTAHRAVTILRYSGVHRVTPIDVSNTGTGNVVLNTFTVPSITTTEDDTMVVRFATVNDDGDGGTIPADFTASKHTTRSVIRTSQLGSVAAEIARLTLGLTGTMPVTTESLDGGNVDFFVAFNVALNADDTTPPVATPFSPPDNLGGVSTTSDLVIDFDEVTRAGTGTLSIVKVSDGSIAETITVSGALLSGNGSTRLTLDPTVTLEDSTSYHITWTANAFKDTFGNHTVAETGSGLWDFITGDFTAPAVSSLSPADDATDVATTTAVTLTFTEDVTAVAGKSITLKRSSDNGTVSTVVTGGGQLSIDGSVVTIGFGASLAGGTSYYVLIDAGAFIDGNGNGHAGIANATTWNFSTASVQGGGAAARLRRARLNAAAGIRPDTEPPTLEEVGIARETRGASETIVSSTEREDDGMTETVPPEPPAGNAESPPSVADPFRARVCRRVALRVGKSSNAIERVNARLLRRFGFSCV